MARSAGEAPRQAGHIIEGGFGSGKSHLLGLLAQHAQNQHFVVSQVSISKETPLFNLERTYAAAIRNAVAPDINDDVMSVAIGLLDWSTPEFKALEEWASSPASGLSPWFAALLYILSRGVLGPEDKLAVARFLSGHRLGVGKLKAWLRSAGTRSLFDIRPIKASDLAQQRLRFAPALFRAAGFSGWCVLLDEIELIGRYSSLQRGKSYAELARWLGLEPLTAISGIVAVAAVVDDFKVTVLDGRLDEEKLPRLLDAKGLTDIRSLAEIGMRALGGRHHQLTPPDRRRLERDLGIVKGLYERSYNWSPRVYDVGAKAAAVTMRGYVKSWITGWDIERIYGTTDTIIAEQVTEDLSENKDFEALPDEPPEEEK